LRRRLDLELVRRGLSPSRTAAQRAIGSGLVTVGGAPALNPARLVDAGEPVQVLGPPPRFVSRGGEKLDAALDQFVLDVAGVRALDAGASTGGFTDCLLQRGAAAVVAVDVGHGQLHPRIRDDTRVSVFERLNVRHLEPGQFGPPFDLLVADLSFISLKTVMAPLLAQLRPGGDAVLLVKPQFEAGRTEVARGHGVIDDPEIWVRVRLDVETAAMSHGAGIIGWMQSPLRGAEGNTEFLLHARTTT
jgi:23S rRNA (cytidine1920-2'-O)/16S rRNA (cytidine1409-2'-O)-methyltransferase